MPFKSRKQRAYLYANDPEVAAEFEAHTPKGKKLPNKVGGKSSGKDVSKRGGKTGKSR